VEFTDREWIELLSGDYLPSKERVIYTSRFRTKMRIRKDLWRQLAGFSGIELRPGKEVELVSGGDGGPQFIVPDWVTDQLSVDTGDWVCITQREGQLYLKKLDPVERPSRIPGWIVVDTFGDGVVTRTYSRCSDLDSIRLEDLEEWLARMGRLRHDPLVPFRQMDGWLGLLARKTLLGRFADGDLAAVQAHKQRIADGQQQNGSWGDGVLETAANLIRLLELGATMQDPAVERAAQWLLELPEPVGLPGLFLVSEKLAQRFNEWKTRPGAKGRPHHRESKGELRDFCASVDYSINSMRDRRWR
jgi:hypothetical protein